MIKEIHPTTKPAIITITVFICGDVLTKKLQTTKTIIIEAAYSKLKLILETFELILLYILFQEKIFTKYILIKNI